MAVETKKLRNKLLRLARQEMRRGDVRAAHRRYQRLTGVDPDNPTFHLRFADISARLGQKSQAVEAYLRAAMLFTRDAFEEKAIATYRRALALDPDRVEVSERLAGVFVRLGRPADAITTLQAAVSALEGGARSPIALRLERRIAEIDPGNVPARLRLAGRLEREDMHQEAICEFVESIVESACQGAPERIPEAFRALVALEPPEASGLSKLAADGSDEAEALLDKLDACRAYHDALEDLYRRVSQAYRRRGDRCGPA